jgi:hypothetical protein
LAEARPLPVETTVATERPQCRFVTDLISICRGARAVNEDQDRDEKVPPPVLSAPPERDLERKLKRHPEDPDAKADVGSDQSMDASDPSAAAQPGQGGGEPVPSSGFPD